MTVPVATWTGMGLVAICLLMTGALTTTKVPVAPVSATNMLLVGVGWVDDGEEPARSAVARLMDVLVSIILALLVSAGVPPCHLSGFQPVLLL
jgi:uncharacterized membrane protein YccC